MSIRIQIATTPEEIRDILQVRHKVYVEQEGFLPDRGGYLVDHHDAYPTTRHLIAVDDGRVVGGIRLTPDGPVGMAADTYLDFRTYVPEGSRLVSGSVFCVDREARGSSQLLGGLLKMGAYWAVAHGKTHVVAPLNPDIESVATRVGMRKVGEPFTARSGLEILPLVMALDEMVDPFVEFVRRQELGLWTDTFMRDFFHPDEVIFEAGDPADAAYFLVDGEVEVLDRQGVVRARLGPGELFGELSLLSDEPRLARVVARGPCEAMVLPRDVFQRQVLESPERTFVLLKAVSQRFRTLAHQLEGGANEG